MAESPTPSSSAKPAESSAPKPGFTTSSADRLPKGGKGRDEGRTQQHQKHANSETVTAQLQLRGFPTLRAKRDIAIVNAGPAVSGQYYVRKLRHSWQRGVGYLTSSIDLIQSKGQEGDRSQDCNPTVSYGDLYDRNEIYVGPRRIGKEVQATFTWGDGNHIISLEWNFNAQNNRAGNESTTGGMSDGITGGGATSKPGQPPSANNPNGAQGVDPRCGGKYLGSKELLQEDIATSIYSYQYKV